MTPRARHVVIASTAGVLAAIASVLGGVWLAGALDDTPPVDGEFVLDQPGVFAEPTDPAAGEVNADATGEPLPVVDLLAVDDSVVRLDRYRGAPLVVNIWYSFCPPCQRELVDFATVHAEVGGEVQFVGVDPFDSLDVMQRFATERGVTYDLLRDDGRELATELGIVAYPVTLFVDADGRVLRQTGALDATELRAAIAELFPEVAR
jgi:peroxiredoxin